MPVSALGPQLSGLWPLPFALALLSLLLLPSAGRSQDGAGRCGDADPEISISVCSGIIQSGRARGRDLAVAHTNRGIAYVALQNYDRALEDLDRAIAIDSRFSKAFANRGAVYGARQDFAKAIADFTQVLKLEPDSAAAFADRASMYRLDGQHEAAIKDYGEAIKRNPAFADALLNRATTLAGTSRCSEAVADFTRAIELNPSEPIAYVDRGVCHEAAGRDDLALEDYSAHLKLDARSSVRARATCGVVLPHGPARSRAPGLRTGPGRQSRLGGCALRSWSRQTPAGGYARRGCRYRDCHRDAPGHRGADGRSWRQAVTLRPPQRAPRASAT